MNDPFDKKWRRIFSDFDSFFNDNISDLGFEEDLRPTKFQKDSLPSRKPLLDITDRGDFFLIIAELPGVDKKNIDLKIDEKAITIQTKVDVSQEEKGKDKYYRERRFSSFFRQIPLPTEIVPEKTTANFKNGILEISLYKKNPKEKKVKEFKVKID